MIFRFCRNNLSDHVYLFLDVLLIFKVGRNNLNDHVYVFHVVMTCYTLTCQHQDQDSLLVKRRNDSHSPGPVIRELVPSLTREVNLATQSSASSADEIRIGKGIPIPDSLGEEATFINICIGNGSLKCHRVLIPTTPSFGDKVICWYTGFTFKTFI